MVMCRRMGALNFKLPVISYRLPVIGYQLSVTSYQLSVISYQLSVVGAVVRIPNSRFQVCDFRCQDVPGGDILVFRLEPETFHAGVRRLS
ncbi:MAG: hypothetical protein DRH76_10580 [Deltaproteobacteria bacterium]|nr:MAG: hypothetical protein DRH76_10580 [Deltaproteobacteria bacterium]